MSRFDDRDIKIDDLENHIADISYVNSVIQEALELIAKGTEEDSQKIAQETLESIA
jgi:hypothetical protein